MNNLEVAKQFLKQEKHKAKSSNGNFYFEGNTLYSYGRHYPVARISGSVLYVNNTGSSVTTEGRHKTALWKAFYRLDWTDKLKVIHVPCKSLTGYANCDKFCVVVEPALEEAELDVTHYYKSSFKRVKVSTRESDLNNMHRAYNTYKELCEHFGVINVKSIESLTTEEV